MKYGSPEFIERGTNGIALISANSLLQERRVLFLFNPIDQEAVAQIIQQIIVLETKSSKPITIIIGSPGGDIQQGLALLDVILSSRCIIRTISVGLAASMASVILAAGTPGYRFCTEHSRVMLHEPLLSNDIRGSCSSIQEVAKHILERKKLINDLLSCFTKQSIEEIEAATAYDHFYSAKEAVEFGLVDHVAGSDLLMELLGGVEEDDFS